jgi:hypothetical protein
MIAKRHTRRHKRDHVPFRRVVEPAMTPPAPGPTTAEPIAMSGDKDRTTELQNKVTAYQNTVPTDDQHRRDIADCVAKANDEIKRLSGSPRGLQQPK